MNAVTLAAAALTATTIWVGSGGIAARVPAGLSVPGRAGSVVAALAAVAVTGVVAIGWGGARLGLAGSSTVVVLLVVRRLRAGSRLRRTRHATQVAVIELCDGLACELKAGLPTSRALELACGADPAWRPVAAAARLGGDVAEALRAVATRPGARGLDAVAAAWEVAARSGAALADVLDRVADALRHDQEARAEVTASLAAPRATAKMLAVLPVFGLGLGASMGAQPLGFLLGSPVGLGCLSAGLVLALSGLLWVERLADAAEA